MKIAQFLAACAVLLVLNSAATTSHVPPLKVYYFNAMGRAEQIRLALSIGGVPFEDVRLNKEQFAEMKSSGKLPMGSLPVLEVDGKMVCQSAAIMNYASKMAGLYPSDEFAGMKVEEVKGCLEDIAQLLYSTFSIQDLEVKIAKRKELLDGLMGQKIAALNKVLEGNGKKLAVSDAITSADIELYCFKKLTSAGFLDGIPTDLLDRYPKIMACASAVATHPAVVKWNAEH